MHKYTLAKDHAPWYEGPDWLPFNLWQLRESPIIENAEIATLISDCAAILSKPESRPIWEAIAAKYEYPDNLSLELPIRCAEFRYHWRHTPKRTPSEHKAHCQGLKRHADILAVELARFFTGMDPIEMGDVDTRHSPNFTQLLSEEEQDAMQKKIDWHHFCVAQAALSSVGSSVVLDFNEFREGLGRSASADLWGLLIMDDKESPGIIPDLAEITRRIGLLFSEGQNAAPIERPNSANAERNYFVRRLLMYFESATGEVSPALVAKIVSMFYEEAISDNEVQQQRGRLPSGKHVGRVRQIG